MSKPGARNSKPKITRGHAIVEFALVAMLLALLIVGVADVASIYSEHLAVVHAAGVAVRWATLDPHHTAPSRPRAYPPSRPRWRRIWQLSPCCWATFNKHRLLFARFALRAIRNRFLHLVLLFANVANDDSTLPSLSSVQASLAPENEWPSY